MGKKIDKSIIEDFIEWARNCGEDAFYIFDNSEEAIEKYLDQKE